MPIYKDSQNNLYEIPSKEFEHFVFNAAPDAIEITQEEAEAIRTPSAEQVAIARKQAIQLELIQIDLKSIRSIREGDEVRIAQWESQASALRAELATLG